MDLYCPACRGLLAASREETVCTQCRAIYENVGGVPVLILRTTAQQEGQRKYFDAEFADYERYAVDNWRRSFIDRIFEALRLPAAAPYLDVGVGGSGATVIEAARAGIRAAGCDLSVPGVLTAATFAKYEGLRDQLDFAVCAAEELPYGDAAFGAVSAVAVLEHLDDDGLAMAEIARVTRPGGRVWITVPHAYRFMLPVVWPFYWIHDRRIGHKRHYDERRLVELAERNGFRHVATSFTGHPVKLIQAVGSAAFPSLRKPNSRAWWAMERADLLAERRRWGAMQLNAVFERA